MNFETWIKSDLKKPVNVKRLDGVLFFANDEANLFGAEITDDGAPAEVSGAVTGYAIRNDGVTVVISGDLDGNRASIVLPNAAYSAVGPISIVLNVGATTVGAWTGYVVKTSTDIPVDPGEIVPNIETLLGMISNCNEAAQDASDAADAAYAAAAQVAEPTDLEHSVVLAKVQQSLTSGQKAQARQNIGADIQQRSVTYDYTVDAGSSAGTNLKTLIDADLPTGYTFLSISGYTTGSGNVVMRNVAYADLDGSISVRSLAGSSAITATATIYYLCIGK